MQLTSPSGSEYEPTPEELRRWADEELPYGVPFVYAGLSYGVAVTLGTLLVHGLDLLGLFTVTGTTQLWVLAVGTLWAAGGWITGTNASTADSSADADSENSPDTGDGSADTSATDDAGGDTTEVTQFPTSPPNRD